MNSCYSYDSKVSNNCSVCIDIHYWTLWDSTVHWVDLALFMPTFTFMLFLLLRLRRVRERLQRNWSPIFSAFFFLVFGATAICTLRCIVSMCLTADSVFQKIGWLITRFSLLFVEASFIVFALIGSALENNTKSVICVVVVTLGVTATYSGIQTVLEMGHYYDDSSYIESRYDLYEHGGMLFLFISSAILATAYCTVLLLGLIPRDKLCIMLPRKSTFYWYVVALGLLNLVQAVGSGLLFFNSQVVALCVVDFTSFVYFSLFTPLVYIVFLRGFFKARAAVAYTQRSTGVSTGVNARAARTASSVSMNPHASFTYRRIRDDDRNAGVSPGYASASLNDDVMITTEAADVDRISMCEDDEQLLAPFDANFYAALENSATSHVSSSAPSINMAPPRAAETDAFMNVTRPSSVEIVEPGAHRPSRGYAIQHADFLAARSPHTDTK